MIGVLFIALAGLQSPSATVVPVSEEIQVLGERLRTWRGRLGERRGEMRCDTTTSTGDGDLDRIGCEATLHCLTEYRPQIIAASDRRHPAAERRALQSAVNREVAACFERHRETLIADLADRRYRALSGAENAEDQ